MMKNISILRVAMAVCALTVVCPVFAQHEQATDSSGGSEGRAQGDVTWTTSGEVVELADVGNYTYLNVDNGTEKIWVAAPQTKLSIGDQVKIPVGALMRDYYSKGLDRVFERIYFVAFVDVEGARSHGLFATLGQLTPRPGGATGLDLSGIEKVEGGVTVARIFDDKAKLTGKEILIRGKVVKFSSNIMGTNWIHLQDGTASAGSNSDLTVTTSVSVRVGDTILVRGVLLTSRDFGFGYNYDVIVENAEVTVE